MLVPVNPPVHFKVPPKQALAVKVRTVPEQTVAERGEIVGFEGTGLTVIMATLLESEVHPFIVQATLYDFVAVGVTVILVPDKPSVQPKVPDKQTLAVSVALFPIQIMAEIGVIVGLLGMVFTVIMATSLESLVQPFTVQATL
jgi:hypothetical protein